LFFIFEVLFFIFSKLDSIDLFSVENNISYISYDQVFFVIDNIYLLGDILYNYHFVLFLIASMILLISMLGSILLTVDLNPRKKKENLLSSFRITRQSLAY
jgi:NADH:ubiquinone oxidoreductase subunit 6 (subunit J)